VSVGFMPQPGNVRAWTQGQGVSATAGAKSRLRPIAKT